METQLIEMSWSFNWEQGCTLFPGLMDFSGWMGMQRLLDVKRKMLDGLCYSKHQRNYKFLKKKTTTKIIGIKTER